MADRISDIFDGTGRGVKHEGLRRTNERAVLSVIAFNEGASNAEISRLSGLAPQTVSAILVNLETAGLIERGEALRGRRGQPATPIHLRADGAYSLGCEIGWRHADLVLIDLHARVLAKAHIDYDYPDARFLAERIAKEAMRLCEAVSAESRARLVGFGVAMPTGLGHHIHHLGAPPDQADLWHKLDVETQLETLSGMPVTIFNDGNAACWAELVALPTPRPTDFIYLHVSAFIAAGIVAQSQLWQGATGNAANLGSMLVKSDNADQESQVAHHVASVESLRDRLRRAGIPVPFGHSVSWPWPEFGKVAEEWVEAAGSALAKVLFNTMAVVESRHAVIDGSLPQIAIDQLVACTERHIRALPLMTATTPASLPTVRAGHHNGLAPAIGAAELVLYRRYFSRDVDIVS